MAGSMRMAVMKLRHAVASSNWMNAAALPSTGQATISGRRLTGKSIWPKSIE